MTPMVRQYAAIKQRYPDAVLFFRLGDFYEMFFEDAERASRILDIVLTSREGGNGNRIPMCGVPYHAAQGYITRLTREGLKVAICEQVEDPKAARGIVKREVIRIITPGTNILDEADESQEENFIVGMVQEQGIVGLAHLNMGTGTFRVTELGSREDVLGELARIKPTECVIPEKMAQSPHLRPFLDRELKAVVNTYEPWVFSLEYAGRVIKEQFKIASMQGLGLDEYPIGAIAAGAVIHYLRDNMHVSLDHVRPPAIYSSSEYMVLDRKTLRNLEIITTTSGEKGDTTLLKVLNRTVTPLGGRLLRQWIRQPLIAANLINDRLDAVEEFFRERSLMFKLREALRFIRDLERILGRLGCNLGSARDLVALKDSLKQVPQMYELLSPCASTLLVYQRSHLHHLDILTEAIEAAIVDTPPLGTKEGGMIRRGYHAELDELYRIAHHGKEWLAQLQQQEVTRTGIKSLKIRYNKVFGYYIEITKANLGQVPDYYIRRQTLVNAERFVTPELKEYEERILGAEERSCQIELEIFEDLRSRVLQQSREIQELAESLAVIDILATFAYLAQQYRYVRPTIDDSSAISITGGRHPVVEHVLEEGRFVENDTFVNCDDQQLLVITGPNMAGKSTYLRQVALLVLMAQSGSFVPAEAARFGVVDKIFTRIGASDNLARGESTFMVEMIETAHILNNATARSLIILDEIGRGTSTFDGVSIAWAVCEHLCRQSGPRPKTLFATHYHELTALEENLSGVKNYTIMVKEYEDEVVFIRKIMPGSADRSYGIHVGKMAGLPAEVVVRAEAILRELESGPAKVGLVKVRQLLPDAAFSSTSAEVSPAGERSMQTRTRLERQLPFLQSLPQDHPVVRELIELDINALTPLQALNQLNKLQIMVQKKE
ncbi:MAG TPA: DNA mismatch repair protein MutS [Thermodesulfobacteriota bacterium]|nr:DNA mismatch repair protein MutS [Thermodesulfobacteriota bacterium]